MSRARRSALAGAEPLSPRRKWWAITLATLLLVPSYWSVLAGLVSVASDRPDRPNAGPYVAFGLALVPFVFMALAFLSEHPRAPGAVVKAMILAIVVGIPVSALAQDAVTGFVAALGAGGTTALRPEPASDWKTRWIAVLAATAGSFLLVRIAGEVALLLAPILPFTSIGVADHLAEGRSQRRTA